MIGGHHHPNCQGHPPNDQYDSPDMLNHDGKQRNQRQRAASPPPPLGYAFFIFLNDLHIWAIILVIRMMSLSIRVVTTYYPIHPSP